MDGKPESKISSPAFLELKHFIHAMVMIGVILRMQCTFAVKVVHAIARVTSKLLNATSKLPDRVLVLQYSTM